MRSLNTMYYVFIYTYVLYYMAVGRLDNYVRSSLISSCTNIPRVSKTAPTMKQYVQLSNQFINFAHPTTMPIISFEY